MRGLQSLINVSGLACDRQFARKCKNGPAALWCWKRRAIGRHLVIAELAGDAARQHTLDEGIRLEDHRLALARRPEFAEGRPRRLGMLLLRGNLGVVEVLPGRHRTDELHESEAAHKIRAALRKMKCERRAPI